MLDDLYNNTQRFLCYLGGKLERKKGLEKPWLRLEDDIKLGVKISDESV